MATQCYNPEDQHKFSLQEKSTSDCMQLAYILLLTYINEKWTRRTFVTLSHIPRSQPTTQGLHVV